MIEMHPPSEDTLHPECRDLFSQMLGASFYKSEDPQALKASSFHTPLGPIVAIGNDISLYLLEFFDKKGLQKEIKQLLKKTKCPIILGACGPVEQIKTELANYFSKNIQEFKTPLFLIGTPFQRRVWEELKKIPRNRLLSKPRLRRF